MLWESLLAGSMFYFLSPKNYSAVASTRRYNFVEFVKRYLAF
jgi:hypothetical protein